MINNQEFKKLENEITTKAISLISTDSMAEKLAKKMQSEIEKSFEGRLQDLDLGYWLRSELEDPTTPAGKAFDKAMSKIAENMVKSI